MIRARNLLTILILVFLIALGVLQWRWVLVLGHAEEARRETALRQGMSRFAVEFDTALIGTYIAFKPNSKALRRRPGELRTWVTEYAAATMTRWNAVARYPQLIRNLYWVEARPDSNRFFVLQYSRLQPVDPPPELADHFAGLQFPAKSVTAAAGNPRAGTRVSALMTTAALIMSLDHHQSAAGGMSQDRLADRNASAGGSEASLEGAAQSFFLVAFDLDYIRRDLVPTLLKSNFAGEASNYSFVIVERHDPEKVLFSSTESPASVLAAPDAQAPLFAVQSRAIHDDFPLGNVDGHWLLAAREAGNSVAHLSATSRFWTLATTFGSLLLLTVSIALMMASTWRLQSTARQQINFVAGVSHELYSPLAVIRSAAENLADGIDHASQEDSREYARLICRETQRLVDMVDNTLEFAGIESDKRKYDLRPVDLRELAKGAVAELRSRLENAGMTAVVYIPADLPPVLADRLALTQVIQNLVINAVKYAGVGGWVGISACRVVGPRGKEDVLLEVADRGPGIETADLAHVLEPFYRGANARSGNIAGSGLGLALVARIVAAHGGKVGVKSRPDSGTRVSITLPTAEAATAAV